MYSQGNAQIRRYEYIDCVKGLAILCITFLHFENGIIPGWLDVWIGMFMITAFYFTSGWVFGLKQRNETPRQLWSKRLYQLGIPYLWFGLAILLFDLIWWGIGLMSTHILGREIYKYLTFRGLGTLWFLPVLFGGEMLFCILKSSKRPWLYGSILFVISYISGYIYFLHWRPLLFHNTTLQLLDSPIRPIVMALSAWPIIGIGYLMCIKLSGKIHNLNKYMAGACGAVLLLLSIWFIIASPFNIFYLNSVIATVLPVMGFIGIFILLNNSRFVKFFSYWGNNSLILMCTHYSITMGLLMAFDIYIIHHSNFTGLRTIIYFLVCILLTYPMVWFIKRHLSFMLGKKKTSSNNA